MAISISLSGVSFTTMTFNLAGTGGSGVSVLTPWITGTLNTGTFPTQYGASIFSGAAFSSGVAGFVINELLPRQTYAVYLSGVGNVVSNAVTGQVLYNNYRFNEKPLQDSNPIILGAATGLLLTGIAITGSANPIYINEI